MTISNPWPKIHNHFKIGNFKPPAPTIVLVCRLTGTKPDSTAFATADRSAEAICRKLEPKLRIGSFPSKVWEAETKEKQDMSKW